MVRTKKNGRAICVLLGMVVAAWVGPAYADCGGEYCNNVYVDQLYVEASGGIWLRTSGTETALSCTPDSGVFLRLASGNEGLKNIYAALLTAQTSGWTVHVRIVGGSNPCAISYVLVDRQ